MERQEYAHQSRHRTPSESDPAGAERRQPDVLARLEDAIGEIQDSDTFRRYLDVESRFHHYSWRNIVLILSQRPDATRVAGYTAWLKLHRYVKRGERGVKIIVPMAKKVSNEQGEDERRTFFGTGTVFDVAQTDGEPLPEVHVPVLEGEEGGGLMDELLELAQGEGIHVGLDRSELPEEAAGAYWPKEAKIRLKVGSMRQMSKTLAHELGHHFHLKVVGEESSKREERETIAESVAYVVCQHFGLDSGERSFPYVAIWAKERQVFQQALGTIQAVSATTSTVLRAVRGQHPVSLIEKCHRRCDRPSLPPSFFGYSRSLMRAAFARSKS